MLLVYFLAMVKNREERGHPSDGNCKRAGARQDRWAGSSRARRSGVRLVSDVAGSEKPEAEGFHVPANLAEAALEGQDPISAPWLQGRGLSTGGGGG